MTDEKVVPIASAVRNAMGREAPQRDVMAERIQHQADQIGEVTPDGRIVLYKTIRELDRLTYNHPDPEVRSISRIFLEIAQLREKVRKLENKLNGKAG